MSADTWAERQEMARTWLLHHADVLPFEASAVRLTPVPNWGGFANASFSSSTWRGPGPAG